MVPRVHQGGQERICLLTARLLQKDCAVTVLIYDDADCVYDLSGLDVINIHSAASPGLAGKLRKMGQRIRRVGGVKKAGGYDLCYSFGATANLVNLFSRKREQVWVGIRGYDDLADRVRTGLCCRLADRVVCCARIMEEDLRRAYRPKATASLYNPCDREAILRQMQEPIPAEEEAFFDGAPVVVTMGRDAHLKGHWHLLKAFALAAERLPEARLLILGRGSYAACRKLAGQLGLEDRVWFAGARSNPFPYLRRSSLYVLSSQDGEGFPNALVEAMAAGLPVAATNCKSGPAEILMEDYRQASDRGRSYDADYGVLLPACGDTENYDPAFLEPQEREMARQMLRLLTTPELAQRYRERAGKRAADFSTEAYLQKLERLLRESGRKG